MSLVSYVTSPAIGGPPEPPPSRLPALLKLRSRIGIAGSIARPDSLGTVFTDGRLVRSPTFDAPATLGVADGGPLPVPRPEPIPGVAVIVPTASSRGPSDGSARIGVSSCACLPERV